MFEYVILSIMSILFILIAGFVLYKVITSPIKSLKFLLKLIFILILGWIVFMVIMYLGMVTWAP